MNFRASLAALVSFSVLAAEDADKTKRLLFDWGGLTRYGSDNTEVTQAPEAIFLGDDVVEQWSEKSSDLFSKRFLNRGIAGQTTPQMLVRFRQDVIDLKPKVVVIQATSNDLAGFSGPITEKMTVDNIKTMSELARLHGIRVVLASATPVCNCDSMQASIRAPGRIIGLNGLLKEYAAESGATYLDFYAALGQGRNMKRELTSDGFLPNEAGYAVMRPLAEKAIADALK